jgi:hypothetical protein
LILLAGFSRGKIENVSDRSFRCAHRRFRRARRPYGP